MNKYASWIGFAASIALIIGGIMWYSGRPGQYDTFAGCIAERGAKFYGAFWCPHCQEQKAQFGRSAKLLPYVECSTPSGSGQLQVCIDEKIEGYPTWEFEDGARKSGTLSFSELSEATGCPLVKDN